MGKSFKIEQLEQEADGRIKEVIGSKLKKPLSGNDVSQLCSIPFDILEEKLVDPSITRVKTPLGDFLKHSRKEYSVYSPRKREKIVVQAVIKLKFIKSDHVSVKVNR